MATSKDKTKSKATKKPKQLSSFEYDMVWMAYRYAIGRHTIACDAFARDLPKYVLGKISEQKLQFMSYDIRREIENALRWTSPGLFIEYTYSQNDLSYDPVGFYIKALKENNIKTLDDLKIYKKFHVHYPGEKITAEKYKEDETCMATLDPLSDLIVWDTVAKILDKNSHYIVTLKSPDGRIEECECIKAWHLKDYSTFEYHEEYCPIDKWINNSYILTMCCQDFITDIRKAN